jgi:hypothetical protein
MYAAAMGRRVVIIALVAVAVAVDSLDLDPDHVTYSPLAELATATEKARRDSPAIAVCEI